MAISKLGDVPGQGHSLSGGLPNPLVITVPAGGIPAGSTIIVMGWFTTGGGGIVTGVTDSKGNVYTLRAGGTTGTKLVLADAQVANALVAGDTISVASSGSPILTVLAAWFTTCYFDRLAEAVYGTTTAATGGAITTPSSGELILGIFGGYGDPQSSAPSITTPGSGYTNQTGKGQTASGPVATGMDWESKIGSAAGAETATATMNATYNGGASGATVAYTETPPPANVTAMIV
jgi:hypothetical protein